MIGHGSWFWNLLWAIFLGMAFDLSCVPSTSAQSMDYGSLEKLFGEAVTTSATGSPQRSTEVPANMVIVTADEIRRSGARDIPGILRHVAGIDVLQWASDDADVSIRGYDEAYSSRTLVLIDGRQVYADFYGFVPWSTLPIELSAIRQIEIVKGPSSALFGFNAVGGVINIVTYNPMYDDLNTASVRVGTQGLIEGSGVATFKFGTKAALRLSGGLSVDNEFGTPIPSSMVGAPRTDNTRAAIDAYGTVALTDKVELVLEASRTRVRRNEMNPIYALEDTLFDTNSVKAQLTADAGGGLLKFTAYSNWIAARSASGAVVPLTTFNSQVIVAQAEDVFRLGARHTMRAALEYRYNSVNTSPTLGGKIFYDVVSASGMWNWQVARSVSLTNAVRFDHLSLGRSGPVPANYPFQNADWDRNINKFSFNSGLVWRIDAQDTLRLLAGRGAQLPNLADTGAVVVDLPVAHLTGIPSLETTEVTNYELAWDRNLTSLAVHLRASLFHQRSKHLVSFEGGFTPIAGGVYITPSNIGNSDADGLELSADGKFGDSWQWSLDYRAEFVDDSFLPFAVGGIDLVDYQHSTPKHVVKAGMGWSRGAWEADTYLRYQSNSSGLRPVALGTTLVPIDQYVSVDARVAYRLTDWATIAISGQNLLQARQHQTSGPAVERQVFGTLSVNF